MFYVIDYVEKLLSVSQLIIDKSLISRHVVLFDKASTEFLSYVGYSISRHFKLCCAVTNFKYSLNWPYSY